MIEQLKLQIKNKIEEHLKNTHSIEVNIVVEKPKKEGNGDLSIPLFVLAKSMKKPLPEIAEEISAVISDIEAICESNFAGGFLNIGINRLSLAEEVLENIHTSKDNYGSDVEGNGKTICIDYSAPNIAKPFSVGHLRSTIIGQSLKLINQKLGYNVVGINHLGDWGTQFGMLIRAYELWGNDELINQDPIKELLTLYVRINAEADEKPTLKDEAREIFRKLEEGDEKYLELWKWFRDESLKEFEGMYELLNVSFESTNGEAFYNDKMNVVIDELEEAGLLKEDQGATIVDLGEKLPPALIKKTGGATLYITRDLAAIKYRFDNYKFDKALYVVGGEQKNHFQQLFTLNKLLGKYNPDNLEHVSFGMVLKDGKKMSTRKGKIVKLEDVIREAKDIAYKYVSEKNPNLEGIDKIAEKIGVGAVIFNDLKNHRTLDIEFDLQQMVKFEGQTGPYLQYATVRTTSILENNSCTDKSKVDFNNFSEDHYYNIAKTLDEFPSIVKKSSDESAPNYIAKYLLGLASDFSRFYSMEKILCEDETKQNTNLYLVECVRTVLTEGMRLLGIEALERM